MKAAELERLRRIEGEHFWFQARRRELSPWLEAAAHEAPAGPLLDLGVGTGGNLELLAGAAPGRRVIGIDRSAVALAHARAAGVPTDLLRAQASPLPLRDESLALVTALDLFEHLREDGRAAREIARCLLPGGQLIATVPARFAPFSDHDRALGHHRRYGRGELEALLETAGLEVTESRGFNLLLLPLVAAWRALPRPGRPAPPRSDLRPIPPLLNRALGTILAFEASFPLSLKRIAGISWWVRARRRTQDALRMTAS